MLILLFVFFLLHHHQNRVVALVSGRRIEPLPGIIWIIDRPKEAHRQSKPTINQIPESKDLMSIFTAKDGAISTSRHEN